MPHGIEYFGHILTLYFLIKDGLLDLIVRSCPNKRRFSHFQDDVKYTFYTQKF